jgi:hypothetical protein
MRKLIFVLAVVAILMEVAAIIMAWPLFHGWHPELVWPFLICFVGGFVILLLLMGTHEFWRGVFGCDEPYPWED